MRARLFIAAMLGAGAAGTPVMSGDYGWTRFTNARFGASAEIPTALFLKERAPDDGDGQSFQSGDGTGIIRLYGSFYSATSDTFVAYAQAAIKEAANDGLDITYKTSGPDFFAYSGFKHDAIVYNKTILGCQDVAETIEVEYPVSDRALYNVLIKRMAASLEARGGLECH